MHKIQGRKQLNVYAFVDDPPLLKDIKRVVERILAKDKTIVDYDLDYIIREVKKERSLKYGTASPIKHSGKKL